VLIAGNWKMYKGPRETREFCAAFEAPEDVEAVLREVLGDPQLELHFRVPDSARSVDARGAPVTRAAHDRRERLTLPGAGIVLIEASRQLETPAGDLIALGPFTLRIVDRVVDGAAEVPDGDDGAALLGRKNKKRVIEVRVASQCRS
jgi:hypothetical protein